MSKGYELSKKYYPKHWTAKMLVNLVKNDKLTAEEYEEITGFKYPNTSKDVK